MKSKLRLGISQKFSEQTDTEELSNIFLKKIRQEEVRQLKKGKRIFLEFIRSGIDDGDFMYGTRTFIARFYIFKIPRIISNGILRKKLKK